MDKRATQKRRTDTPGWLGTTAAALGGNAAESGGPACGGELEMKEKLLSCVWALL